MKEKVNIHWFRRDLRLEDNAGLYHALKSELPVLPVFIFDRLILDKLENKADARVSFIHAAIIILQEKLVRLGSSLRVFYGKPEDAFKALFEEYAIDTIFTNRDYEAYAIERDKKIIDLSAIHGTKLNEFKDHVILDHREVLKENGEPYTVFTPYSKKWKSFLTAFHLKPYPTEKYFGKLVKKAPLQIPSLEEMEFQPSDIPFPSPAVNEEIIKVYANDRDYPGTTGTSHLGVHLRFGTISIRQLARFTKELSAVFLGELIWRDFYQMILAKFPRVGEGKAFKPAYDNIQWRNNEEEFDKWCKGTTGYPIVDAGMRELNATGFMHNRIRMVTASFLCKHLLIDWRWGEAYFAAHLLDFDLAANNGGWQWAAGSGCDAAPYFRIFNPYLQTKKFDKDLTYTRKWVPEFEDSSYPPPIVEHTFARARCLVVYKKALSQPK